MSYHENLREIEESIHHDIEGQNLKNNGVEDGGPQSKKSSDEVDSAEKGTTTKAFILDPREPFLQTWSIIFVASCVIAVSLDPLFFYLPVINEDKKCLGLDKTLKTTAIILRSVTDTIYIVNIILQFRTGFIDEHSQKLRRATLNKDSKAIARRYLCTWSYFLIDIFVILPIPQVVISIIFSEMRGSKSLDTRKWLNAVVLFQYVPRLLRIYLSWNDLMRSASKVARAVWVKAAFNFFLYIIASHVLGAFWYFFSIERETACWHQACENHIGCVRSSFNCDRILGDYTFLNDLCPITTPNATLFDFGIFLEALQSGVGQSKDFPQKFFQCFWWGLRNLSSFGQDLQTSNYIWETCFAVLISIFGLLLFLYFIGNLQIYMQSAATRSMDEIKRSEERSEEVNMKMKLKERTIELWVSKHGLSEDIKRELKQNVKRRLEENNDVYVENLLDHLAPGRRKEVKHHLCLDLLKTVPMLRDMDKKLLIKICDSLKPVYYNEHNYIVREGDPIDTTFFIKDGIAWSYSTCNNGEGSTDGFSSHAKHLGKDQFFGEELLEWGLSQSDPDLSKLPSSSRIIKTHKTVEAYAITADDLKILVSKNQFLIRKPSERIAAITIQQAFRRHQANKNEKSSQLVKGDRNMPSSGTQGS